MVHIADALVCFAKELQTVRVVSSAIVSKGPCILLCVHVAPSTQGNVYAVEVYNGENAQGVQMYDYRGQYSPESTQFGWPIYCNRGLYLALSTNLTSVTVTILPLRD